METLFGRQRVIFWIAVAALVVGHLMAATLANAQTTNIVGTNASSGPTTINAARLGSGPVVLSDSTLVFDRPDTNTFANDISGSGSIVQNGLGTTTLGGDLTYAGPTIVNAGTLVFPNDVTFDAEFGSTLIVASKAAMASGSVFKLNANSSSTAVDISGAGTVDLVSTIGRTKHDPDLFVGANNNGISTANYGIRLGAGLNLGSLPRLVWAISSQSDVARYGLTGCDCQFAGPISGSGQLSLMGKNSWTGVNVMEEQFAFNASNSFTGPLEVLRGSVYLGNPNALTGGNVLILDPAAAVNSRLFLYGFNATISDLQSGGSGDTLIANGNNITSSNVGPATLTVVENNATTFAGNIADWYTEFTAPSTGLLNPTLSLVKNGPAALTLGGTNTYSGTTTIKAGKLYINGSLTGGGAVMVNSGSTLGGSGTIASAVTVMNGGAIETGGGNGVGETVVNSLALGSISGDLGVLKLTPSAPLNVVSNNGLVLNGGTGSVTINVGGTFRSPGVAPLIAYKGTLGGAGFDGFKLGSMPAGISGYLSNNIANASIDFVVTHITVPRWSGAFSAEWSTNAQFKNWVDSDGVTPIHHEDGEAMRFEDGVSNTIVKINVASVLPLSVVFSNSVQNYTVSGAYGINGAGGLTKQGAGQVTLSTTNHYTGNTTIEAGKLVLGAAGAIPGGTGHGDLTVNGTLDVGGFSPTVNNLSGSGTVDNITVDGSPVLTVNKTVNATFAGVIQNTSGALGLILTGKGGLTLNGNNTYTGPTLVEGGSLTVNGALGAGGVTVQNGAALGGTGNIAGPVAMASGSAFKLAANSPLTMDALTLNGDVSVTVSGNVSTTKAATYVLLNHAGRNGTGAFLLAPVPHMIGSGFSATLKETSNQVLLVVAKTQPTGTIADVKHVVIFMQENRSFDHYFGTLHGVHGFSDHVTLTFTNGNSVFYQPSNSSYELPFHTTISCLTDLPHDWSSTHQMVNSGKWDQWVAAKHPETMAFYERTDIPYYYALADNFTICDEYHCSVLCCTFPNRVFLMTGMNDPNDIAGGPVIDNNVQSGGWGTNWVTYPEMLQQAGVSWKVYQANDNFSDDAVYWFATFKNAPPGSPLYVNGLSYAPNVSGYSGFLGDYTDLVTEFKNDVLSNTLPSVSWVLASGAGAEHPYHSSQNGEILTKGLLDALASNPEVYNSTVFILNYDENDGFFDHAVPILPPTGTSNEFINGLPIGLGVRVPCIIVSPWSRGGYVCSQVFDHTSVIRFLEKWTGVMDPNISAWRRQVCGDLTSALDFAHPNTNYPNLPTVGENDCSSGTTASPPSQQSMPRQELGTLKQRPLPYQPNAIPALDCTGSNCRIVMTNSGTASVHFSIYANAYSTALPAPYDVNPSNSATASYKVGTTGNYDFSCYGPNGFLRRFAGKLSADCGHIEVVSYLNPSTGGVEIAMANSTTSNVVFSVTNGYTTNTPVTYSVPANRTRVVLVDTSTNSGWYDITATANSDSLFVRRFTGHVETNGATPSTLVSSENPAGYGDSITLSATVTGYNGTPNGTMLFYTNGVTMGPPVTLVNGTATLTTMQLARGTNVITAVYSGDLYDPQATLTLTQVITNHPPVASNVTYMQLSGHPLQINIPHLLSNDSDIDSDPIYFVGTSPTTINGLALTNNMTNIFVPANTVPDAFTYTIQDSFGDTNSADVFIHIISNAFGAGYPTIRLTATGGPQLTFPATPGLSYTLQMSTNLSTWTNVLTTNAPAGGSLQFNPVNQPQPAAYYRLQLNLNP